MTDITTTPFSARYSLHSKQIDNAFPKTARTGLTHLLFDLVERQYVAGWTSIAKELQRIGRHQPSAFNLSNAIYRKEAETVAIAVIEELDWLKIYDFCERLYGHLAQEVGFDGQWGYEISVTKEEIQQYIAQELVRLFLEEDLAYEFSGGIVRRRGRKHTVEASAKAHLVLGEPILSGARKHYEKALQFFRSPATPDYENCVKEAVCSVEAAAKILFPEAKAATLGDFAKWLSASKTIEVSKTLCQTITSIYAFRSGADGVGHGGGTGGKVTKEVAEYILAVCASQIIYLVDLSDQASEDIPF